MPKHQKPWLDRWEELEPLGKGGQGRTLLVARRGGTEADRRVLKVLNRQEDPERRARMHREVAALETIDHPAVPKLVESNASAFRDLSVPLYMVMSFVEGPHLEDFVRTRGALDVDGALHLALRLLDAIEACHRSGLVHRDIKPDNIIVDPKGLPHLVDWGLSFSSTDAGSFETGSKEIGNRFLHLPELQEGDQKRLEVSDLTQAIGILLYAVTAQIPRLLTDSRGRRPHQREAAAAVLSSLQPRKREKLLRVFDQGFDTFTERRFANASSLIAALKEVLDAGERHAAQDLASIIADIKTRITGSHDYANSVGLASAMSFLHEALGEVLHDIAAYDLEHLAVHFPWGRAIDLHSSPQRLESAWGVQLKLDGRTLIQFRFEGTVVGSEIVLSGVVYDHRRNLNLVESAQDICRISLDGLPTSEDDQQRAVRQAVLPAAKDYCLRHLHERGDYASNG